MRTFRPDSASNVSGVTNFCASAVITTVTPAGLHQLADDVGDLVRRDPAADARR